MVEAMKKSSIDKKPYTIKANSFGTNSFYMPDIRKMAGSADSSFLLCNIEEEKNNRRGSNPEKYFKVTDHLEKGKVKINVKMGKRKFFFYEESLYYFFKFH